MIIRKIKRKARLGGSDRGYASTLMRYVTRGDADDLALLLDHCDDDYLADLARYAIGHGEAEKAASSGANNLFGETREEWQVEIAALMHAAGENDDIVDHWVMSWHETDHPTAEEFDEVVDVFARCLEVEQCPLIKGRHQDTDNDHGHLALVRLDPATGARVVAGKGWDIDAAHRAIAVIHDRFPHWQRQENDGYRVEEGMLVSNDGKAVGPAYDPSQWKRVRSERKEKSLAKLVLSGDARRYEDETGLKSRERIAQENVIPAAKRASNWADLHKALAGDGIEIVKKGSGAVFIIDGKPVKASLERETSLKALEKRYRGEFQPRDPHEAPLLRRRPQTLWPNNPQRERYHSERRVHAGAIASALSELRGAHTLGGTIAIRSAVAGRLGQEAAFPSFESWLASASPSDPFTVAASALNLTGISAQPGDPLNLASPIKGFRVIKLAERTIYRRPGVSGLPALVDIGSRVFVNTDNDVEAVRVAVRIVAERSGSVDVFGNDPAFDALVLRVALEEKITLRGKLAKMHASTAQQAHAQETTAPQVERQVIADASASPQKPLAEMPALQDMHPLVVAWQQAVADPKQNERVHAAALARDAAALASLTDDDRKLVKREAAHHQASIAARRAADLGRA